MKIFPLQIIVWFELGIVLLQSMQHLSSTTCSKAHNGYQIQTKNRCWKKISLRTCSKTDDQTDHKNRNSIRLTAENARRNCWTKIKSNGPATWRRNWGRGRKREVVGASQRVKETSWTIFTVWEQPPLVVFPICRKRQNYRAKRGDFSRR